MICNFLDVTLNEMCGVFKDNIQLPEDEVKLLNTYRSMNQKGKDKLLERAEELLDLGYVKGEAEKMA